MQPTHTTHQQTAFETPAALDESQHAARLAHATTANTHSPESADGTDHRHHQITPELGRLLCRIIAEAELDGTAPEHVHDLSGAARTILVGNPNLPTTDQLLSDYLETIPNFQELTTDELLATATTAIAAAVAVVTAPAVEEEPVDGDADDEFDPTCNKRCTKCSNIKPFDEFAKKRGARAAICKACNRAYQHEHYKATADVRRPQLKARSKRIVAELNALIDERRAVATCNNCGGDDKLTATSPHGAPSQLAKAEKRTELIKALDTAVWECRVCRMSAVGSSNVGHSRVPGAPLLDDAIVTAVRSGATTAATVTTAVQQVRATTIESVRQRMLELTAAQVLVRTSRGQYAVGPQAKP